MTDDQFAFFTSDDSTSLYQYEYSTEKWSDLPQCSYCNSGLAVIDSELTTVGRRDGRSRTNKLFTLRQRNWVKKYPPINTARSCPAVISTSDGNYLIVIRGYIGGGLMCMKTLQSQDFLLLVRVYVHEFVCLCVFVHIVPVCVCVCAYCACVCVCVCVWVCVHVCVRVYVCHENVFAHKMSQLFGLFLVNM